MDELIRKLREWTFWCGSTHRYSHDIHPHICDDAANALEELQAQLAQVMAERDALLRAQEEAEKNEPLTLDELRQMDGKKIYIRYINHCKIFYNDEISPYYGKNEQYIQRYNGVLRACDLPLKYYGEEWLAYRRKPKEGAGNGL